MITAILTIAAGIVVGILSGMLGVGGGTMMIPIFRLGYGLQAVAATATSLFAIIPISIAGSLTHIKNKTCVIPVGITMGICGAICSPIGVWLANQSPSWAVIVAAAAVIAYSSVTMFRKAYKAIKADKAGKKVVASPADYSFTFSWKQMLKLIPIGFIAGFASGYVGVGGGFIMVPMFVSLLNMPMRNASGTSLLAIILIAIPGTITQLTMGNVDVLVAICIAIGAIPGAVLGTNLAKRLPEKHLRLAFSVFLLISAIVLVIKEIGL